MSEMEGKNDGPESKAPDYDHMEILQGLWLKTDIVDEVASELDEPLGLVRDLTYDGKVYLVRWHDDNE